MDKVIFLIMLFGWFSMMIVPRGKGGMPRYRNPPPPPYPKKKTGSVPHMRNPPKPPKLSKDRRS